MVTGQRVGKVPRSDVVTNPVTDGAAVLGRIASGCAAVFIVILAGLHVLEPEFDPSWRFISEYQLGNAGWLMSVAFAALAASSAALVGALWSQIRTAGGYVGLVFLAISTLGFTLAAIFTTDSLTATVGTGPGMMHNLGAVLGSNVSGAAYFLGWSLARNVAWRPFRRAILWVTGLAIIGNLASFVQQGIIAAGAGRFGPGVAVGWPNRALILAFAAWMGAIGLLVARHAALAAGTNQSVETPAHLSST